MLRNYKVSNEDMFGSSIAILRSVDKYYKYDPKAGKRLEEVEGIKLSVTSPCTLERVDIKLPGVFDFPVENKDLLAAAKDMEYVVVSFEGLTSTPYVRDGRQAESYKAKGATAVTIMKLEMKDGKGKA